jgi:hypothetical protein
VISGGVAEAVVIGRGDANKVVAVKLWNAGGKRWVMHSGGDVMFGRRYSAPAEGEPLIKPDAPAEGARHVVSAIAPAFIAADVRTVNLETVVSTLGTSDIYPGKRFILNSPPETLAGLDALGVDAIDLANNHGRDYLTRGIDSTHQALADNTLPYFGQANRADNAPEPLVVNTNGDVKVGMLGFTSVEGSFVNDSYPIDGQAIPADLLPDDMRQYQRVWGFEARPCRCRRQRAASARRGGCSPQPSRRCRARKRTTRGPGSRPSIPSSKIGCSVAVTRALRRGTPLAPARRSPRSRRPATSSSCSCTRASSSNRRRRPACARWRTRRSMPARASSSATTRTSCKEPSGTRASIIYSLGNFIFDQDFGRRSRRCSSTRSGTGTSSSRRARPLEIEAIARGRSPAAATRNLRRVWEMSVLSGVSERDSEKVIRVFATALDANTKPATLRLERNTAVITTEDAPVSAIEVRAPAGQIVAIGAKGLVDPRSRSGSRDRPRAAPVGQLRGQPRGQRGRCRRALERGQHVGSTDVRDRCVRWHRIPQAHAYLENKSTVLSRPVARVTLTITGCSEIRRVAIPLDPTPRFSFRMRARMTGNAQPGMRVDLYNFNDSDPTEDPTSTKIGRVTFPFDLPRDNEWHVVELPIAAEALIGENGLRANQLMPYVQLEVPASGKSRLDVDALEIISGAARTRCRIASARTTTSTTRARDQMVRVKTQQ